jgi:uncharacterized protein YndB with AHSA1/START domain
MSNTAGSTFIYVTYIRTTPEKLWAALTDPRTIKQYWFGINCESDFKKGSPWKLAFEDGGLADSGEILDVDPGKRLVIKWRNEKRPELKVEGYSVCTMELEPADEAVKLTITHTINKENAKFIEAVAGGWPKVMSNLKSLLEMGDIAMRTAYKTSSAA